MCPELNEWVDHLEQFVEATESADEEIFKAITVVRQFVENHRPKLKLLTLGCSKLYLLNDDPTNIRNNVLKQPTRAHAQQRLNALNTHAKHNLRLVAIQV
ncbi:hypothetical protein D917_01996, partial [Trichinella nativa]